MKVLVFGAGAVGSTFGGFLSPHHEVTLLGRKRHLDAIRKKGLWVSGIWGRHRFKKFQCFTDFTALARKKPDFDLILVCVKAYDTLAAGRAIRKILRKNTLVISLQNGLGNLEALEKFIPEDQILGGRVIFGAALPAPGELKITVIAHPVALGEASAAKDSARARRIAALFSQAGVPSVGVDDIQSVLWKKVLYNCALNPLASILKCHYGKLTEQVESRLVMTEVVCEIYDVARKAGVKLEPEEPREYLRMFYSKMVAPTYDHRPSMLQDLEKGKKTEIDSLNGAIVKLGKKYGVPTPVNQALTKLIKEREQS